MSTPNVIYPLLNSNDDDKQALVVSYAMDFQRCMKRMSDYPEKQMAIIEQTNKYKEKTEYFGMPLAVFSCLTMDPIGWCSAFGLRTRELMTLAKRILYLCVTASNCGRNCSTFDFIHTKRRNRLKVDRMGKLVYINYNKCLNARQLQRKLQTKNSDPTEIEDINYNSEWLTGEEGAANEWVYGEDGLTWTSIEDAMGVNETDRATTRRQEAGQTATFGGEKIRMPDHLEDIPMTQARIHTLRVI